MPERPDLRFERRMLIDGRLVDGEAGTFTNIDPATEEVIGTSERVPTLLFNGYGEYVAGLYKGLEKERLWV